MSTNSDRIIELFSEAKTKAPGEERERFLDEACGEDTGLRQQIESLSGAENAAGEFLKNTRLVLTPEAVTEKPGDRIGRYKLVQKIGEGGMGTVWMAEQSEPIRRLVALKVIKQGMDSGQVLARFEAERQALALMDHPNIAKVFDAGATSNGRPYFVMELVKGVPLTKFCDEQQSSIRERLELFVPVCQAIQHAHQKGIVHRDISPSNVLVALYDGRPVPKVIDFGIAKAIGQPLTERSLVTEFGAIIGKLEYMSPEQAEFNQLDIDTRSDIYSLGALLYELLTGTTPLTREALRQGAFEEILRRIREQEPPKPSTRLGASKERLASTSAQRKLEPVHLTKLLRGDLDWIVMKALEKERNRRYETANGFAMDIQRHLNDEPVLARPPSRLYILEKMVRRHKLAFAAATSVAAALIAGVLVSTWHATRATRAEAKARVEQQRAERESVRWQLQAAEQAFESDNVPGAFAMLARMVRNDPSNRLAAERLLNGLEHRSFVLLTNVEWWVKGARTVRLVSPPQITNAPTPSPRPGLQICEEEVWAFWTKPDNWIPPGLRADSSAMPRVPSTASAPSLNTVDLSADGLWGVCGLDNSARIWDRESRLQIARLAHDATVTCTRFSPDSRLLATGTQAGKLRVWDTRTGVPVTDWIMLGVPVGQIWFTENASTIFAAGESSQIAGLPTSTAAAVRIHASRDTAPGWLPKLAEAIGGIRFGEWDIEYPSFELLPLKAELERNADNSPFGLWARQFLARITVR